MQEPTIICPKCGTEIKLTESLAAPLVAAARGEFERRMAAKDRETAEKMAATEKEAAAKVAAKEREAAERVAAEIASKNGEVLAMRKAVEAKEADAAGRVAAAEKMAGEKVAAERAEVAKKLEAARAEAAEREKAARAREEAAEKLAAEKERAVRAREEAVRRERETLDERVAERLRVEKVAMAAEEGKKARAALALEMEQKAAEMASLQEALRTNNEKLAEAQKAQAELMKKERELEDARREMELTIQRQVSEGLGAVREKAQKDAEERLGLKVLEREQTIAGMAKTIEELKKKSEQGSQQAQGEALELQLEGLLAAKFPQDVIEPVAKGEHGGDILQRVAGAGGAAGGMVGTILWEMKRTKNWSEGWLAKLRDDQRAAKAEVAVLVTAVLPKGVETFDLVEGIWVTHPRCVVPVGMVLRGMLLEVASARQSAAGLQTKAELVYGYLTGPRFKLRVQAIVEAFTGMEEDLQKERKAIMKQWAKREEEIGRVLEATVGMYGDLQGIAGKGLAEIEGLDVKRLGESISHE